MGVDREKIEAVRELTLTKLKARARTRITPEIFDDLTIERLAGWLADDMWYATIKLILPAKEIVQTDKTENVPATWWDHFKAERGWKHNTREIVTSVTHYHQCPHIGIRHRENHLDWLTYAGEPEKLFSEMTSDRDGE